MLLIDFNKPKKIDVGGGFDGGPLGGYIPQMSDEDAAKWRGKRVNKGKDGDRIEIRKSFDSCQIVIFVAKDGWIYSSKNEAIEPVYTKHKSHYTGEDRLWLKNVPTKGKNVRISMNGPLKITFDEWNELTQVIEEAKQLLEDLI